MTPSDILRDFMLLIPTTLGSVGVVVLVPKRRTLLLGATTVPLNYGFSLDISCSFCQKTNSQKRSHYYDRNNCPTQSGGAENNITDSQVTHVGAC